jgi:hypothetical protein
LVDLARREDLSVDPAIVIRHPRRPQVRDLAADDFIPGEAGQLLEGTVAPQVGASGILEEDRDGDAVEEFPDQVNLLLEGILGFLLPGDIPGGCAGPYGG